jgi:hypothetical protein
MALVYDSDHVSPEEFDSRSKCYSSALKAFISLCDDDHNSSTIETTKMILNRLIDFKVLSPIEDSDDDWDDCEWILGEKPPEIHKLYQNRRLISLFKVIYSDGRVMYKDNNRSIVCVSIKNRKSRAINGFVSGLIDSMFPIEMPYLPYNEPYKVYIDTFLTDLDNGDYDTLYIESVDTPSGEHFDIDLYFKEVDGWWKEIGVEEFLERKDRRI